MPMKNENEVSPFEIQSAGAEEQEMNACAAWEVASRAEQLDQCHEQIGHENGY